MNNESHKQKELKKVFFGDMELHKTDRGWEGTKQEGNAEWKALVKVSRGDERLEMKRTELGKEPQLVRLHTKKIEDWLSGRVIEAHINGCDCKDIFDNFAMAVGEIRKNNWKDLPETLPRFQSLGSATTLK